MEQVDFFPYDWNLVNQKGDDLDHTLIRVYGLDEKNNLVAVIIRDFEPYVYLEIPAYFNERLAVALKNQICEKIKNGQEPTSMKLVFKKRLYGADFDMNGKRKLFPYFRISFKTPEHIYDFKRIVRFTRHWPGLGKVNLKVHEDNAHAVLQLCCSGNIPVCGWITFEGRKKTQRKETRCELEYDVSWQKLKANEEIHIVPRPLILSYDLEVYSSVGGSMPKHHRPADEIFQISCILGRQGDEGCEEFLLTLGEPNPDVVGERVEIRMFETEAALIVGFTEFIQEFQPSIITGYNIFTFDIDYTIHRAKFCSCFYEYARQGLNRTGLDIEKTIEWGSQAFQNQKFLYLHAEGRLFVDLLPVVRRDHKFRTYTLKVVSDFFLGETKDPLTYEGIFMCYRLGMKGYRSEDEGVKKKGARALGVCGKYCMQDSALVWKLFEKLQTWVGLTEMSRICNTQIFFLFTQGQQVKVFSQVYKKCMEAGYVVEKDGFQAGENESYTGAHVFEPMAGVHDWIVPLDFTSLYPTIIIAYNICWSTWVQEGSDIPDEDCHIFDWYDHYKCEHDTVKRSGKKAPICEPRYYRFLKKPKGVMPELLEHLLGARNSVKGQIKDTVKEKDKNPERETELSTRLIVLDKRQLALKISANSMYGIMGVTKGYLPFMPGAMCVTAKGRESIQKVSKIATEEFGITRIYGDTDSIYAQFPGLTDPNEIWDRAISVAAEISKSFPSPMKLLFEMTIYKRFMILTKKRYMGIECDRDGEEKPEMSKKGVSLVRRDNSQAVRDPYASVVMDIFNRVPEKEVIESLVEKIMAICRGELPYKHFIITKRVGEISEYKIRPLSEDEDKKAKRLADLNCTEEDYKFKSLPAQAQLLLKMQSRGENVGAGTRLEYVVTTTGGHKARQFVKIEDATYFMKHTSILKIDYLYYVQNLSTQMDQVLEVVYGRKKFVLLFYRQLRKTFEQREKLIQNLEKYIRPEIKLKEVKTIKKRIVKKKK